MTNNKQNYFTIHVQIMIAYSYTQERFTLVSPVNTQGGNKNVECTFPT